MPSISSEKIAEALQRIKANHPKQTAINALHALLLESLSPREREVYIMVNSLSSGDSYTSRDVVEQLNIRINQAGNILGTLRQLGLIKAVVKSGSDGLYYEWSRIND